MNVPLALLRIAALPYFLEEMDALPQGCEGGSPADDGCWTNYVALADLDGDGDLDVVIPNAAGYFTQGVAEPLVILENDGAAGFSDVSAVAVGGFSGWLRQVAIGDVDVDGDLDIYAPDAWGGDDAFFVNDGNGVFSEEIDTRLPGAQSRAGAARFGDVDGDGDLDLLVTDWGTDPFGADPVSGAQLYLNDGAGSFSDASALLPIVTGPDGTTPVDVDFLDVDGDFDLDVLVDSHEGDERLWINDGTGTFTDVSASFPDGAGGLSYGPGVCDVDADGDLDIWVDNEAPGGREQLLINYGDAEFSNETEDRVIDNDAADDNGVVCVDVDSDGDLDAAIPSLGSNEERVLINDGAGNFEQLDGAFSSVSDGTLWMDFGDVDGDGRLDVLTGQGESSFVDRVYLGTTDQPVDDESPRFRAVESHATVDAGEPFVVRFAVTDATVTDAGPRLSRAWLIWEIDSANQPERDARFIGGDLFRAETNAVPGSATRGSYAVCASDPAGNARCSEVVSFVVEARDDDGDGGGGGGCGCRTAPTSSHTSLTMAGILMLALGVTVVIRRR